MLVEIHSAGAWPSATPRAYGDALILPDSGERKPRPLGGEGGVFKLISHASGFSLFAEAGPAKSWACYYLWFQGLKVWVLPVTYWGGATMTRFPSIHWKPRSGQYAIPGSFG